MSRPTISLLTWVSRLSATAKTEASDTSGAMTRLSDTHRPDRPVTRVGLWRYRMQLRHELRALNERQLHDVGVNPEWVRREIKKPFWQD
jgi:uncharacterized protein YjiS (DUF1127 family)